MAETAPRMPLSQDEAAALGLAVLAHVGLVAALVYLKPADLPPPPPERMEVTISDETGPVSTSPDPQADPAADRGPVVGDMIPPPLPEPVEIAKAEVRPTVAPPRPVPVPRAVVQPKPQTKPAPQQVKQPQTNPAPPRPGTRPGNSRFDNAFGGGIPGGNPAGKGKNPPAQATGQQRSSWSSLIGSRVKAPWDSCKVTGLDIEMLYVDVSFTLATDGSIQSFGDPVVGGVNPANRSQVAPFKACAIRAIKLAAPFRGLPPEFYDDWKSRKLRLRKKEQ